MTKHEKQRIKEIGDKLQLSEPISMGNKEEVENLISEVCGDLEDLYNDAKEFFTVTELHRDDFEMIEYDSRDVPDEEMEEIADDLADAFLVDAYWTSLETLAQEHEFPAQKDE